MGDCSLFVFCAGLAVLCGYLYFSIWKTDSAMELGVQIFWSFWLAFAAVPSAVGTVLAPFKTEDRRLAEEDLDTFSSVSHYCIGIIFFIIGVLISRFHLNPLPNAEKRSYQTRSLI